MVSRLLNPFGVKLNGAKRDRRSCRKAILNNLGASNGSLLSGSNSGLAGNADHPGTV